MKILFVCNQGVNRSRTAAELFKDKFETKYSGLFNNLITQKDLEWADLIVVMEDFQRTEIGKIFPKQYLTKRIICFELQDIYYYNQPELIQLLKIKMHHLLQPLIE